MKYLSTTYVFVTNPSQNEGALHIARQRIISNKALLHSAVRTGLPSFVQAKPFAVRTWQPPNFSVSSTAFQRSGDPADANSEERQQQEPLRDAATVRMQDGVAQTCGSMDVMPRDKFSRRRQDDHDTHWLGNKVCFAVVDGHSGPSLILKDQAIADVAEAIVGAAYLTGGHEIALKVTKALNIPIPNIDDWSDFGRKALAPPPDASAKLRNGSTEAVEAIVGHKFRRPHLLAQALVSNSHSRRHLSDQHLHRLTPQCMVMKPLHTSVLSLSEMES